jgi:hypothetical protein
MFKRLSFFSVSPAFLESHEVNVKRSATPGQAAWIAAIYTLGYPLAVGLLALGKYYPKFAFPAAVNWLFAGAIICAAFAVLLGWIGRRYAHRSLAFFAMFVGGLELIPGFFFLRFIAAWYTMP